MGWILQQREKIGEIKVKKAAFIRPFFQGRFLNYFQLFLISCENNPEFDWIILTDNKDEYRYPKNVHKVFMTFDEAKDMIQKHFDFTVHIDSPAKLHDYKAAFGYIFAEYLKDYSYWGTTDYDVIYGNLGKYITDDLLENYDKLFVLGHMSLYRNDEDLNRLFMKPLNGEFIFRKVFQSSENMGFDEDWGGKRSINDIFRAYGKRVYENRNNECAIADIYVKSSDFRVTVFNNDVHYSITERKKRGFFTYENGKLGRYIFQRNKEYIYEEYMYIHLQKRQMELIDGVLEKKEYLIIPNAFVPLEDKWKEGDIAGIRRKYMNLHYFKIRYQNFKIKLAKYLERFKKRG